MWPLIHHCCPRCPYMGKAEEAPPLARGNPELPEVTGWSLGQTFTQISHELGKRNLGSLYPLGARNVYLLSKQTLEVLLELTLCFPPGRDFQDRCPLIEKARRKLTDISTHISTLRKQRRQNFSLTAFQPALDLLSEGIIEFPTYFSEVSPAEVP